MGDPRRNKIFSEFVFRNFPKATSVLVVADGKGELATFLSRKYKVHVIEAKPRQETLRKRVFYQKGWFTDNILVEEDIIVGMHPDEATAAIIRAAVRNNKKWAVVPCCLKGLDAHGVPNFSAWKRKLRRIDTRAREVRETCLPFNGKNTVLWSI